MDRVDKLIDAVRQIREEAAAMGAGPTNSATPAGLGYNSETDGPQKRKKKYIYGGKNSRKWWLQFLRR